MSLLPGEAAGILVVSAVEAACLAWMALKLGSILPVAILSMALSLFALPMAMVATAEAMGRNATVEGSALLAAWVIPLITAVVLCLRRPWRSFPQEPPDNVRRP